MFLNNKTHLHVVSPLVTLLFIVFLGSPVLKLVPNKIHCVYFKKSYSIAQIVLVLNSVCVEVTMVPINREVDNKSTVHACVIVCVYVWGCVYN